jgi:hypothetical protein
MLIDTLTSEGQSNAFEMFVTSLRKSNQPYLADILVAKTKELVSANQNTRNYTLATASTANAANRSQLDYVQLRDEMLPREVRNTLKESVLDLQDTIADATPVIEYMVASNALNDLNVTKLKVRMFYFFMYFWFFGVPNYKGSIGYHTLAGIRGQG